MTQRFTLFVAGDSPRSQRASRAMRALCEAARLSPDQLEIVDVLERPDLADASGILATPTVVMTAASTTRRVIGDLSDVERLSRVLDIDISSPAEGDDA